MNLRGVFVEAMKLELDGNKFYNTIADALEDKDAVAMFEQLALDEVLHYRYIRREFKAIVGDDDFSTLSFDGAADIDDTAAFPELEQITSLDAVSLVFPQGKEALKALPENPSEEDALLFALGVEDTTFTLYHNSAKQATDEKVKQFFLNLAGAERKHFEVLMQRYESSYGYPR